MKLTESEGKLVLNALRIALIEATTLIPRLPNPMRDNMKGVADECKTAIKIVEDAKIRGED